MAASLEQRAEEFEKILEDYFIDPDGLVYDTIKYDEMRPWEVGDFAENALSRGCWKKAGWPTMDAYCNYENNPATTGAYFAFRVWKYRETGDSSELDKLERAFLAVEQVFEISEMVLTRGAYLKPFGGLKEAHRSKDMTPDNSYGLVHGLCEYYEVAPEALRPRILNIIKGIVVDFYMDHDYAFIPPNNPSAYRGFIDWLSVPQTHVGPIFIHESRMMHSITGEKRYLDQYERLMSLEREGFNSRFETPSQVVRRLGEGYGSSIWCNRSSSRAVPTPDDVPVGSRVVLIGGGWSPVPAAIADLAKWDEGRRTFFAEQMKNWWEEETRLTYAGDGFGYYGLLYDLNTGKVVHSDKAKDDPMLSFQVNVLLPGGEWIFNGMSAEKALPGLGGKELALEILAAMDLSKMRRMSPSNPEYSYLSQCLHAPSGWLEAYWKGRCLGYW